MLNFFASEKALVSSEAYLRLSVAAFFHYSDFKFYSKKKKATLFHFHAFARINNTLWFNLFQEFF